MDDLNGRTGEKQDFVDDCEVTPCFEDLPDLWYNNIVERKSCDKTVKRCGDKILKFCKTHCLYILNGRCGEDSGIGHFTYVCTQGKSVIDYMIVSQNIFR